MSTKPSIWQSRIQVEEQFYRTWSELFNCAILEDYWEGKQWQQVGISRTNYKPYVLNIIYSTIKTKMANIIYQNPKFLLEPKPGHGDWNPELANRAANIKSASLNTVIQNPRTHFVKNMRLAALDSFFRFGMVEVGYAADWQNPNKTPLSTNIDDDPTKDGTVMLSDAKVEEDEEVPVNERAYVKHIKARRFRVSSEESTILDHCNWCGYYSFIKKSVLAKTKGIDLPKEIKNQYFSIGMSDRYVKRSNDANADHDYMDSNAYFKVWRLWDNIKKEKLLVLDGQGFPVIWSDKFSRLPFPHVIWDERAPSKENIGFYPMPPVFQWISSQDEINQTREQLRNYRKRFTRKFWYNDHVSADEMAKLSNNIDGEAIKLKTRTKGEEALGQIPNPEIGVTIADSLSVSMSDMNLITGTSANARQQADRTTATESKIIDIRAQVRESVEQMDFKQFVCDAGRETLLVIHENFSEGMWIKLTIDPSENFMDEVQDSQAVYQYILNQEIIDGSYDWDIDLDVVNGTPAQMAAESEIFLKFITIVTANPQIALSPTLLRELAAKLGYKNEKVIRELQKAATFQLMTQMQGQGQKGGNGSVQSMSQNASPNPTNEITSQLNQQIG